MRVHAAMLLLAACTGPAASGPGAIQPQAEPDGAPASPAASAMAPTQPAQVWMRGPGPAPLSAAELRRAHVEALLARDQSAPPASELRQPGGYEALHAIVHDERETPGLRARALAAMAELADARGLAELSSVLETPDSSPLFLRTALLAIARAQGAAAVPRIARRLDSPDPTIRIAAAEALGQIGGPDARAALQKQLDAEVAPEVRTSIERALAKASP